MPPPHAQLVGLTASHTGPLECRAASTSGANGCWPARAENVMDRPQRRRTPADCKPRRWPSAWPRPRSTIWKAKCQKRPDLAEPTASLRREHAALEHDLFGPRRRHGQSAPPTTCGPAPTAWRLRASSSRAGRRQGHRLRRRPPRRPLVPRGAVLPGLELPARRHGRQPLRTGRPGRLRVFAVTLPVGEGWVRGESNCSMRYRRTSNFLHHSSFEIPYSFVIRISCFVIHPKGG